MHRIFLSHSSKDKVKARSIYRELVNSDVKVWFDEAELKAGDSLVGKIGSVLDQIDTFILILSSNSVDSKWVQTELKIVINRDIISNDVRIIPVLLENVKVPTFLIDRVYVDMTSDEKFRPGMDFIKQSVGVSDAPSISYPSEEKLILMAISSIRGTDCYDPSQEKIRNRAVIGCKIPHDENIYIIITYGVGIFGFMSKKGERCICLTENGIYAHFKGARLFRRYQDLDSIEIKLYTWEKLVDYGEAMMSEYEKGIEFSDPDIKFETDTLTSLTFMHAIETIRSLYR